MAEKRERVDAALDMLLNHAPADEPKTYTAAEARRQVRQSTREAKAEEDPYDRDTMKANRKRDSQENILAKLGIDRPHKRLWGDEQYDAAKENAKNKNSGAHRETVDDADETPSGMRIVKKIRRTDATPPPFPGTENEKKERKLIDIAVEPEYKFRK